VTRLDPITEEGAPVKLCIGKEERCGYLFQMLCARHVVEGE
jgi:hypothetical protein